MSKVIALFNQSGRVGKSTLAMNLAYHLMQRKKKVLLIDIDSQASLTALMDLKPSKLEKTVYAALLIGNPLPVHPHYSRVISKQNWLGKLLVELETLIGVD